MSFKNCFHLRRFKIYGEKLKDESIDDKLVSPIIQDTREYGQFVIILPFKSSEIHFLDKKAIVDKNCKDGIVVFKFRILGDEEDEDD